MKTWLDSCRFMALRSFAILLAFELTCPAAGSAADYELHDFRRIALSEDYFSEGANFGDFDNDGKMAGYDEKLIRIVREAIDIPITVLGGAGSLDDIKQVIHEHKVIGVAAGSMFFFKGVYKAVLINYPSVSEKKLLNKIIN